MTSHKRSALLGVLIVCVTQPLDAQLAGVPVMSPGWPNIAGRVAAYALVGRAPEESIAKGWTQSLLVHYLVGTRFTLGLGVGAAEIPTSDSESQAMVNAAFTVYNKKSGFFLPALAISAGHGRMFGDDDPAKTILAVPIDLLWNIHGLYIDAFLVPRHEWRTVEVGPGDESSSGWGGSYGVRVGMVVGTALTVALDHSRIADDLISTDTHTATSWVFGLRIVRRNRID